MNNQSLNPKREIFQIIGCLLKKPYLLKDKKYKLSLYDFVESFHKIVFAAINNLVVHNAKEIDEIIIDNFISSYAEQYAIFQNNNGIEYLINVKQKSEEENFEYNYDRLKKFSLLRKYQDAGINVIEIYDENIVNPKKQQIMQEKFDRLSIKDITRFFDLKIIKIKEEYNISSSEQSKKAGTGAKKIIQQFKETPEMGLGLESKMLTTVMRGARKKKYILRSSGTGGGKSRSSIGDICCLCAKQIWDINKCKWVDNPNGQNNAGLYIGAEMDLDTEVDLIAIAYVSGVPEEHILDGEYEEGEEERVMKASDILDESQLYLEKVPEFDLQTVEQLIEKYKIMYDIEYVVFDYIFATDSLLQEAKERRGNTITREDQVLLSLSKKLKDLTANYDVWLMSMTQVSGDYKDTSNRDETIIRGAKAIADKADVAMIAMPPTQKELEKIRPILEEKGFIKQPNMIFTIYKNRGAKLSKLKIWVYQNLDNMRIEDLFATDKDYNPIPLEKTYVNVMDNEDE